MDKGVKVHFCLSQYLLKAIVHSKNNDILRDIYEVPYYVQAK